MLCYDYATFILRSKIREKARFVAPPTSRLLLFFSLLQHRSDSKTVFFKIFKMIHIIIYLLTQKVKKYCQVYRIGTFPVSEVV